PNIVAVYDTGEDILGDDGKTVVVPYIVMEHVDGQTLRQLLASGRRLLPERALEITAGILAALDYSHRHGIVHRDIKPANVMLTRTGDVKVMDFGIARALADASATMTAASAVMGTAQYLSPEQARGEVVDARSDLYSTGCLLYELLTGRPPFQGDSPVSVAYQHVSEEPLPPSQVDPAVPPSLDPLVLKALAKDPDDRYQTAADFRTDVERAMAGLPITSAIPAVVPAAAAGVAAADATQQFAASGPPADPMAGTEDEEKKRSPWVWIGIAALVLLVAGLALFLGRVLFGATAAEQVSVPTIVGKTIQQAENTLTQQGLSLGTQTPETSDQPKGNILSQNPQAGSQLAKGQSVAVTISAGLAQVQVPQLTGLASSDDAQAALSEVNLNLGNVTQQDSDQPAGMVLSQSPNSGTTVDEGSSVNIAVSNGMVSVPNVVGDTEAQANATLINAGFNVQVINQPSSDPAGTVLAQSPNGGSKAQKGAQVTITVATALAAPEPDRANQAPPADPQNQAGGVADGQSASPTATATAPALTDDGGVIVGP
ncbi:MAG: Stk1 family PASTA domain-containing Ser/Thr kinase, partial [Actinobacteria bacterium]|nr:Stk1 family PASTA domain-containing Ser/Thr kinase [Actinomycetota bacterium]